MDERLNRQEFFLLFGLPKSILYRIAQNKTEKKMAFTNPFGFLHG